MDQKRKPQWWLIGVAALLAGLMLRDSFGSWAAGGLVAVSIAAVAGYEWSRRAKHDAPRCLKCGEALAIGAHRCDSCGSASWTN
jgi:hypothetical protein